MSQRLNLVKRRKIRQMRPKGSEKTPRSGKKPWRQGNCPSCGEKIITGLALGGHNLNIHCTKCGYNWRVDIMGKPS